MAGAWIGNNIDTTAAVVGAATLAGADALKFATVVKLSQNAIIGVAAFLLTLYWVVKVERKPGERPSAWVIWHRFPKFVIGFLVASILATSGLFGKAELAVIKNFTNWALLLPFVSIGLEFLSNGDLAKARQLVSEHWIETIFRFADPYRRIYQLSFHSQV